MSKRVLIQQIEREVWSDLMQAKHALTRAVMIENAVKRHAAEIREHDFSREVCTYLVDKKLAKLQEPGSYGRAEVA